jgi:glutamyl-tRNA synthetase
MTHRGRFAPSPTGPLHLGNARTALLALLAVRARRGTLVMRVEDLDRPRVRPGVEAALLDELRWLGLGWDEGPDLGGRYGPYRQSERGDRYQAALRRLREAGLAYPCFCSRAEVAAAARAPHGPADDGPRYPGTCRELSAAEVTRRSSARPPAWRLRVEPGQVAFDDAVQGACRFDVAGATGDFVVMRADGIAAYQLAVAVDDAAMEITEVVRGDDLLPSTARQLLLFAALELTPPRFAHVPLVVGDDGQRLAKRHGARSLGELRQAGAAPEAVIGLLAASCGLAPAGTRCAASELVGGFGWGRLPRGPATLPAEAVAALSG